MRLRLKYPPTPENAAKFAADIVRSAAEISGATLDYSVESLKLVDDIIEGFRQDGCKSDQIGETLFAFGCYVGEIFVRQAGGKWVTTAGTSMERMSGFPLAVETGKDSATNPIGKVFKRLENGEGDDLPYYYQVFSKPKS
jgi:hypothetical protein